VWQGKRFRQKKYETEQQRSIWGVLHEMAMGSSEGRCGSAVDDVVVVGWPV